jgi:hypothetical protein
MEHLQDFIVIITGVVVISAWAALCILAMREFAASCARRDAKERWLV